MAADGEAPSIAPFEDRVADASPAWIYGATTLVGGAALVATWWAPLAGDVALGLVTALACAAMGWMHWIRRRLKQLPLDGAEQMVWLGTRVALQCWLGRGRTVTALTTTAMLERGGHTEALDASVAAVPCVGPFLVVVSPPSGGFEPEDRVRVTVEAASSSGLSHIERSSRIAEVAERYCPPMAMQSGRLVFRRHDWGRVQS